MSFLFLFLIKFYKFVLHRTTPQRFRGRKLHGLEGWKPYLLPQIKKVLKFKLPKIDSLSHYSEKCVNPFIGDKTRASQPSLRTKIKVT